LLSCIKGVKIIKITESELKKNIKNRNFSNVYLFYGEEKFLINFYIKKIENCVLNNNLEFNLKIFKENLNLESFEEYIETLPFFSDKKIIKILDFNIEKIKENDLDLFKKNIKNLPEYVILIINTEINIKKTVKFAKFLTFLENCGNVIEVKKLNFQVLKKQLISWAKKVNTDLPEDCAELMINRCGNDLENLKNELEKVCAFCEYGKVKQEIIKKVTNFNIEYTAFSLSKDLISRNYLEVFKKINFLLSKKESAFFILNIINNLYLDIYRVKVALESRENYLDLIKFFDYKKKEFRLNMAAQACSKISKNQINSCLKVIAEADINLKNNYILSKKFILEDLILKISLILRSVKL